MRVECSVLRKLQFAATYFVGTQKFSTCYHQLIEVDSESSLFNATVTLAVHCGMDSSVRQQNHGPGPGISDLDLNATNMIASQQSRLTLISIACLKDAYENCPLRMTFPASLIEHEWDLLPLLPTRSDRDWRP